MESCDAGPAKGMAWQAVNSKDIPKLPYTICKNFDAQRTIALPCLADHALPVSNHDWTDHNTKPTNGALVQSNSSVIQLLLYYVPDYVITSMANFYWPREPRK